MPARYILRNQAPSALLVVTACLQYFVFYSTFLTLASRVEKINVDAKSTREWKREDATLSCATQDAVRPERQRVYDLSTKLLSDTVARVGAYSIAFAAASLLVVIAFSWRMTKARSYADGQAMNFRFVAVRVLVAFTGQAMVWGLFASVSAFILRNSRRKLDTQKDGLGASPTACEREAVLTAQLAYESGQASQQMMATYAAVCAVLSVLMTVYVMWHYVQVPSETVQLRLKKLESDVRELKNE